MAEGFKERLKEFQCFERRFEVSVTVNPAHVKKILQIIFQET